MPDKKERDRPAIKTVDIWFRAHTDAGELAYGYRVGALLILAVRRAKMWAVSFHHWDDTEPAPTGPLDFLSAAGVAGAHVRAIDLSDDDLSSATAHVAATIVICGGPVPGFRLAGKAVTGHVG